MADALASEGSDRVVAIETSIDEARSGFVRPSVSTVPRITVAVALLFFGSGTPGCAGSTRSAGSTEQAGPESGEPAVPGGTREGERPKAPGTTFRELEQRLEQNPLRMRFQLSAEGAVVASLAGSLSIGDEVELEAKGRFAGGEHDLRLWTEGDHLRAGPRDAPTLDVPRPPELVPALVIGMTRMGLLHDVEVVERYEWPLSLEGG